MDHDSTTRLLHNPHIHPTTEISDVPLLICMSHLPTDMFKQTGEIIPPNSRARQWIQSLEKPIAQEMSKLDLKPGKREN